MGLVQIVFLMNSVIGQIVWTIVNFVRSHRWIWLSVEIYYTYMAMEHLRLPPPPPVSESPTSHHFCIATFKIFKTRLKTSLFSSSMCLILCEMNVLCFQFFGHYNRSLDVNKIFKKLNISTKHLIIRILSQYLTTSRWYLVSVSECWNADDDFGEQDDHQQ